MNFTKFLISYDGIIMGRYKPIVITEELDHIILIQNILCMVTSDCRQSAA